MPDEYVPTEFADLADLYGSTGNPTNGDVPSGTPSTWTPVDLADVLANGDASGPEPDFLARSDGVRLVYPARCHAFNGEPESGKTWAALLAVHQHIDTGGHALYLDFEDEPRAVANRLLAIGAHPSALVERFHYVRPDEPLQVRSGKITQASIDFQAVLDTWPHTLAVIDGVTEAMIVEGLSPEKNDEYATWHKLLPRRLTTRGMASIQLDHVIKNRETRGRWAIGAQHKLAAIDGAVYTFEPIQPFGIGRHGIAKVLVNKDRPGAVRRHATGPRIADLHIDATGGAMAVVCELRRPGNQIDKDGPFRPTALMEKVSRWLELNPGATLRQIRESVKGKTEFVAKAVEVLVDEDFVLSEPAPRNATRHSVLKPYREEYDPEVHPRV